MPMNLDRMQRDAAEQQTFLLRAIDAELMAVAVCESCIGKDHGPAAMRALAEALFVAWGCLDEAAALRGVYDREALRLDLENASPMQVPRVRDLLEKWRDACRRAVLPLHDYCERWRIAP